jgi:cytochrome c-type biogenesis protein CcmH/NrfF
MGITVTVELRCEVCQHQETYTSKHNVLYDDMVITPKGLGWDYGNRDDKLRCPGCKDPDAGEDPVPIRWKPKTFGDGPRRD